MLRHSPLRTLYLTSHVEQRFSKGYNQTSVAHEVLFALSKMQGRETTL